ncbi:MAG: SCO family protein [Gammaproteobacteria bacterium]|nr:SCO family protein [Gammaproteobacteria bacterium]
MKNTPSFIRTRLIPAVVITVLAMAAGIWTARLLINHDTGADPLAATRFPTARSVQPFSLVDHTGSPFDNTSLDGRWSFLFFGYTHCPDVCPTTLSVLNSVAQRLQSAPEAVRFVMVTVDPERDTPDKLGKFVTYFNGDFVGVTGTEDGLQALTKQLGIMHMRVNDTDNPASYLVDHSAGVFLFDPNGRYHAVFSPPLSADAIAADFSEMARTFK